jgi:hypothetical protein
MFSLSIQLLRVKLAATALVCQTSLAPCRQRQQEAERAKKSAAELQQAVRAKDQDMKKAAEKVGKEVRSTAFE